MVGQIVEGMPWLGTFHSIGVKILRRHAELVGLKPAFTILDTDDQMRLLRQLLQAENIDEKRWPARVLGQIIDGWKNRGITPDQVSAGEGASFAGKGKKLYVAYQERLKVLNAADFGDLLIECIRLFREQPDVLRQYQSRFKYILVDEYQDTNVAQYLWLRLLGQSTARAPDDDGDCCGDFLVAQRTVTSPLGRGTVEGGERDRVNSPVSPHPNPLPGGEREQTSPHVDHADIALRRAFPRTSVASATTINRFMAGAAPRSTTFCASNMTFRAPRSSGWSAIIARPDTSWRPLRTSLRTTKAGSARRCAPIRSRVRKCRSPVPGIRRRSARNRR